MKRLLILGGTGEATELAEHLSPFSDLEVIISLAGRTHQPASLSDKVHIGGFGGAEGLASYLTEQRINCLIDATHPFAAQISWKAAIAAKEVGIPHLILNRPAWENTAKDAWIEVNSIEAAASALPTAAQRVFLSIGRTQLTAFIELKHIWFLMRSIEPPDIATPLPQGKVILGRGPFSLEQEKQLLQQYQIDAIVSKNSGSDATYSKIVAAHELGIPVVMVQRPAPPLGEQVADVKSAIAWLMSIWRHSSEPF
jgi:precorrin-6A/cobalt-precorrin-6A reductase